jgi:hypothetical protein
LATHPRFQLQFTPTSASWLKLVERWFGPITMQAVRGSFDSVRRLEQALTRYLAQWNETAKSFRWTKSAAKIKRIIRNLHLFTRHDASKVYREAGLVDGGRQLEPLGDFAEANTDASTIRTNPAVAGRMSGLPSRPDS